MDFFGAQDDARRKTGRLVALFAAAVLALVLLTNLLVGFVYTFMARPAPTGGVNLSGSIRDMPLSAWVWISLAVLAVVALASGFKYLQVRGGGRAIAESLGGELVHQSSTDFRTRRLLNVVEEMAIAAGTPVPPVYLIEQPSINAFAAGFSPDDAVIGINRGTLEHLNREELQGVVAHEFSHILNGDSRLNLRLIAVLHGILFLGLIGRGLLQGFGRGSYRRSRSSGSSGGMQGVALGAGLLIIGYAGTFFGNLIKAAVSRQREYLADAASVQFTRNPGGIAGALKKIGALPAGSGMPGAAASEASHLFFGQVSRMFLNGLMATHPPLDKRIRAVDPQWDGRFPALPVAPAEAQELPGAAAFSGTAAPATGEESAEDASGAGSALEIHASPEAMAAAVGTLDETGLARAQALIGGLPPALRDAAHDPFAARALMYAFVLHDLPAGLHATQAQTLAARAEQGVAAEASRLLPLVGSLDPMQRVTLVEMAAPALKELSQPQYRTFIDNLIALIKADRSISLSEWVLHRLLVKELKPHFERRPRLGVRHHSVEAVTGAAIELISALAREGHATAQERARAFSAGITALGAPGSLISDDDPDFQRLNRALGELRALTPLQLPRIIKACAAAVQADGHVSPREGALLHGIAATLDCPLPPSVMRPRQAP